jgi:two-component system, sensor histidine kinase LadS
VKSLLLTTLLCVSAWLMPPPGLAQTPPVAAGEPALAEGTVPASAPDPDLRITETSSTQDLRHVGRWWMAPAGLTPDAALALAGDRPLPESVRGKLVTQAGESAWAHIRLRFEPPVVPAQWRVEIPLPTLDLARLYYRAAGAPWQLRQTGDHLPTSRQAMPNLLPVLDLPVLSGEVEVVLELHHPSGALSAPVKLTSVTEVVTGRTNRALLAGGLLGLSGLMVLLSLVEAVYTRSRPQLFFTLLLLLSTLAIAVHSGVAALYIWPEWSLANHWARFVTPTLLMAAWTRTSVWLLGFDDQSRLLRLAGVAWALAVGLVGLAMPWIGDGHAIRVLEWTLAATFAVNSLFCGVAWYLRRQDAETVLAALLVAGTGAGITALQAAGHTSFGPAVWDAFPVGLVLATGVLFLTVSRRLRDLLQASARSHALASHDPLTGLPNETALRYSFSRSMRRMKFYRTRALLVMIEIENLPEIGRKAGPTGQSEALVRLSARLRATLRPFDLLVKLDTHHFVALVEGPITAAGARDLATHMLATALRMQVQGITPRLVLAMTDVGGTGDALDPHLQACQRMIESRDSAPTGSPTIRTRFSEAMAAG